MKNLEIAKIFYDIADILEMKGVEWKPTAYRKAARSLETLSKDVERLAKKDKLDEIPGVGYGLSKKIKEYLRTGKIKEYNKLKKSLPNHLSDLLEVPGLGPKRAKILYKKLKISSIPQLEKAAKQGKISKLETFDVKLEKNILEGIEFKKSTGGRESLGIVYPLAENLKENLKKLKEIERVEIAGSLARKTETIGDIDILIISNNPKKVMNHFVGFKDIKKVLALGPTKTSVLLTNNIQVDLRVLNEKNFGSGLMYFIGSKEHNIALRKIAINKGFKLSEYGLFKGKKLIAAKSEKLIYKKLGMQFIPAEIRENKGEIELALKNKIPDLVQISDIQGDMHVHTKYSEGSHSLKNVAERACELGYKYVNITDHAKNLAIGRGMNKIQLIKQINEIDKLRSHVKIFKGVELNIDKDGEVDFPNKILKDLDCAIAGVHSGFKMSSKEMTKRICNAMENEYVKIIAHPTGRLINKREGYNVYMEKLFDKAKETGTLLEIDGTPLRLDLNDENVHEAINRKIKLSIGSDAHSLDDMDFIRYGVFVARRGYASKENILNCYSLKQIRKYLKA